MATQTAPAIDEQRRDEFAGRLFASALASVDWTTIYLGDRLGLYRALAGRGPLTSAGLAAAAGIHERYAREWLEQQAVTQILDVDDPDADPAERAYSLAPEHAEVLLDELSLNHLGPLGRALVSFNDALRPLLRAFRDGGGVPFADYGEDLREAQAALNRPQFANLLATEWLPALPDVDERLRSDPQARVADIACGAGWSSIAFARAYPHVRVDGYDSDAESVELARRNALQSGVHDRVRFHLHDAAQPAQAAEYALVTVFEALHDMSQPVAALRAMRELAGERGAVLVMDERAQDGLAIGDDLQRFFYGASVLHCLPAGMAEEPSAATGTVMRTETVVRYAAEAGFGRVEVLPIENVFFRFYRLHR